MDFLFFQSLFFEPFFYGEDHGFRSANEDLIHALHIDELVELYTFLPVNTAMPVIIGILSFIFGFAMTWDIFWLAILSALGVLVCTIIRLSGHDAHEVFSAAEVQAMEEKGRKRT